MQNNPDDTHCLVLALQYPRAEYESHMIHIWARIFCKKMLTFLKCNVEHIVDCTLPKKVFFAKDIIVSNKALFLERFVAMRTFETFRMPGII